MAIGHLPEREERGDEQQAGHRQHGGRLLHAAGGHGPQPAGVRLGTPALLEAETLPPQVSQAGLPVGHQPGETSQYVNQLHFICTISCSQIQRVFVVDESLFSPIADCLVYGGDLESLLHWISH